jgi:hypothetical protein
MTNTIATIDMLNRSALKYAHEKLSFVGNCDMQFDASFDGSTKHGATLRVKNPAQFNVTSGTRAATVQSITDTTQTITVNSPYHVTFECTSQDLLQGIAYMDEEYIKPASQRLVAQVEAAAISDLTKAVAQTVGAGSYTLAGGYAPGTALTDLAAPSYAMAMLNGQCAPTEDRCIVANSWAMGTMVNGLKGLFQDSTQIKKQYNEGMMGRTSMADWYANEKTWVLTNTADVAGEINAGTLTSGITTLTVDGFSAAPTAGMVFTVEGIYDVHPETKVSTGKLKQFVTASGATTTSLPFTPAMIYDTTDATQNCSGTPVDNADITFYGSASTSYAQNLMFHKNAFAFVSAKLPQLASNDDCSVRTSDNLSMRVWKQSDLLNDRMLLRIDLLAGWKALRPEWACRISQ